jgi:hypothetical protein
MADATATHLVSVLREADTSHHNGYISSKRFNNAVTTAYV